MLKWLALILVTTVLCWGDTNPSSSRHSEEPTKTRRPVIEESTTTHYDGLTDKDREELADLIKDLNQVGQEQARAVGEQPSVKVSTIPDL